MKYKDNFTFNFVKKRNDELISKLYNPNESNDFIFEKYSNIYIEIKSSINNSNTEDIVNKFKNMNGRFSYECESPSYYEINEKFSKNIINIFLFYDYKRIESFNKIRPNINLDKEVEICYYSVNVPISSVVSLQNQIRELKKK